ncbi:MAG: ribonuclease III [Thermotogae bacterium]|nr:ribonuclease III [Thermotogota bacterium]MCL5032331.1 ribonuclease III [Thermotogota bacterium]
METNVEEILKILKIERMMPFPEYFRCAITHSSYANENGTESYERLEFLGDAMVGLVIAHKTFELFKNIREGELAKIKAVVGSEKVLADISKKIGLANLILVGKSLSLASGDELDSIYADTFESTIAAVFLNFGFEITENIVSNLLAEKIMDVAQKKLFFDYKTALQEYTQNKFATLPEYILIEESGPAHKKNYIFEVRINGEFYGHGKGKSKKEAEQLAAKMAYERLIAK